jgi:hypothetical protein
MDNLDFQLQKLNYLKNIRENLKNGVPALIGNDATNIIQLYINDLEEIIGNIETQQIQ